MSDMYLGELLRQMAKYAQEHNTSIESMHVDVIVFTKQGTAIKCRLTVLEVCESQKAYLDGIVAKVREEEKNG